MVTKVSQPIPALDDAVRSYADAVTRGDDAAAERAVAERAREHHRVALAESSSKRPFTKYEVLARAKIGYQYIVKVRWRGAKDEMLLQNRWAQLDEKWVIIDVEDLHAKAPWSDVPSMPRPAAHTGNGNA